MNKNPSNPQTERFFSFKNLIQSVLPWRFRRMMVLSGAFGLISSIDKPMLGHAKEVVEVLKLSKDPESVNVPIALHSILVSKFNHLRVPVHGRSISIRDAATRNLNLDERKALSKLMAANVPPTLCYTHKNCMAEDIFRLLSFVGEKHQAA